MDIFDEALFARYDKTIDFTDSLTVAMTTDIRPE